MDDTDFLETLGSLRRHASNGVRAPHKPLLLLFALAQFKAGHDGIRYRDAAEILRPLIRTYGPAGTKARVADPIARLRSDGIWRMDASPSLFDASCKGRMKFPQNGRSKNPQMV